MSWKTIRLELAAAPGFPSGSVSRGYFIRVPLTENGSIDEVSLARSPGKATVRRFWSTEPDESGRIERIKDMWALRCHGERVLSIRRPLFEVGKEVAVIGSDGTALPFRVASIRHVGKPDQRL